MPQAFSLWVAGLLPSRSFHLPARRAFALEAVAVYRTESSIRIRGFTFLRGQVRTGSAPKQVKRPCYATESYIVK